MNSVGTLLKRHEISPRKSMGQNFLTDGTMVAAIIRRSELGPQEGVVEIGAGLGSLTLPMACAVGHIWAIEADRKLAAILRAELADNGISNVTVVEQDILKCDIENLTDVSMQPVIVVGNLPYHISSQILIKLIEARKQVKRAILMFQKELAQRLMASPGCKQYGRLSVVVQYCAKVISIADVPASCFIPKPKVDSQVVEIRFHDCTPLEPTHERIFSKVVEAAFGKRRKTLKNALSASKLGLAADDIVQALQSAEIESARRAETLSVEEFIALTNCISKIYCKNV